MKLVFCGSFSTIKWETHGLQSSCKSYYSLTVFSVIPGNRLINPHIYSFNLYNERSQLSGKGMQSYVVCCDYSVTHLNSHFCCHHHGPVLPAVVITHSNESKYQHKLFSKSDSQRLLLAVLGLKSPFSYFIAGESGV